MVIVISGSTTTGKSSSLRFLDKDKRDKTIYLNFDSSKTPPFAMNEIKYQPMSSAETGIKIIEALADKKGAKYKYVIIDTITSLLEQNINENVTGAYNALGAWGEHGTMFSSLVETIQASEGNSDSDITWIILAHAEFVDMNTDELAKAKLSHKILAAGAPGKKGGGMESRFGIIVSTRIVSPEFLEEYSNGTKGDLVITDREIKTNSKYVYQLQNDFSGDNYKLCSPMGLWEEDDIFIDSNIELLLSKIAKKPEIFDI